MVIYVGPFVRESNACLCGYRHEVYMRAVRLDPGAIIQVEVEENLRAL